MSYVNLEANSTGTTAQSTRANSTNFVVSGTWGSGTLSIQVLDPETSTWVTVYSNTTNFSINLLIGSGASFRYVLSGATSPDLDIYAMPCYMKDLSI